MTYRGVARGRIIELEEALPFPEGQPLTVSVNAVPGGSPLGSPELVRRTMNNAPHIASSDLDELEQAIEGGKLRVREEGALDSDD